MAGMILYHGSNNIIKQPFLGGGKIYNDYGQGFYCTDKIELAKEWACTEEISAYVNKYELDMTGMKILDLSSEKYSVLNWLAILLKYRRIRITSPIMKRGIEWLISHFDLDISAYDIIIGYRADDSYFSFARAFVNNQISLKQLEYAMNLGELGIQYVLKSDKAFQTLKFAGYEVVDREVYHIKRKRRDEDTRRTYMSELEHEVEDGVFIRDLMKEGEQ
ncbi:MAG: DUF3990 domain-containing protein [Lachnospiraceae bacterium]|nr:DUF3990 domain-containing protein [Lachnospiraceae bacterium]